MAAEPKPLISETVDSAGVGLLEHLITKEAGTTAGELEGSLTARASSSKEVSIVDCRQVSQSNT